MMAIGDQTEPSHQPASGVLIPIGAWIRLEISGQPAIIAFTYVDPQAGFSAQGWKVGAGGLDQSARMIVRLPMPGVPWRLLETDEARSLGLEFPPTWVAEFYGPQPIAGSLWGGWREHPKLAGRFLPDYPDDLQVLVHDGGPRLTRNPAEAVWVTTTGMDGDVFSGRILNQPHNLTTIRLGGSIKFMVVDGAEYPVMVTEKYLDERTAWVIHPCRGCGFAELFDAPSDLIRVVFPKSPAGGQMSMFTAFCPLCGGVQVLEAKEIPIHSDRDPVHVPEARKRPWWKFW